MEIISDNDTIAAWVDGLADKLEKCTDVGKIVYRKNIPTGRDCALTVYIGCGGIGNTTNHPTSVSGVVRGMESLGKVTKVLPCNVDSCDRLSGIMPEFIVGGYSYASSDVHVITCGKHVVAICDIDTREIFIPDYSRDIGWSGNLEDDIVCIASTVEFAADFIEHGYLEMLLRDIKSASDKSVRVTLVEVAAETAFDIQYFTNSCMEALGSYRNRVDKRYKKVFDALKRDIVVAQEKGVYEAMELMAYMKEQHFVFVEPGILKYTGGKITANTGIYNDSVYNTDVETWISGLRLTIRDNRVAEARCYRAYHPNCSGRHVCLGELIGTPIRNANKVVEALKIPNFSNGYWTDSQQYLGEKITDLEGVCDTVWSNDDE